MYCHVRCYKKTKKREVIESLIKLFIYSTIYWKGIIDENALFFDGGKIPCILVENKEDLLDKDEIDNTQ